MTNLTNVIVGKINEVKTTEATTFSLRVENNMGRWSQVNLLPIVNMEEVVLGQLSAITDMGKVTDIRVCVDCMSATNVAVELYYDVMESNNEEEKVMVEVGMIVVGKAGKEYEVIAVENGTVTIQILGGKQKYDMKEESLMKKYTIKGKVVEKIEPQNMVSISMEQFIKMQQTIATLTETVAKLQTKLVAPIATKAEPQGPYTMTCSCCGTVVENAINVSRFSTQHFGKELCFNCQAKAKAEKRAQEPVKYKCRHCGEMIEYSTRKAADESRHNAKRAGLEFANYHKKCAITLINAAIAQRKGIPAPQGIPATQPKVTSAQPQNSGSTTVKFGAPTQVNNGTERNAF